MHSFSTPWNHIKGCIRGKKCSFFGKFAVLCVSGGREYSFFGKFGVLCFLVTPVLRFIFLPYCRRSISSLRNTAWNIFSCYFFVILRLKASGLEFVKLVAKDIIFWNLISFALVINQTDFRNSIYVMFLKSMTLFKLLLSNFSVQYDSRSKWSETTASRARVPCW